jgi:Tfp pilus assembly protein PilE
MVPVKKRPFILLEILIAISIISILAGFLIYRPFRELKKELEMILSIEKARVWEGQLIELESQLRSKCNSLPKKEKNAEKGVHTFTVSLCDVEKNYKQFYKAWTKHKEKKEDKTEHYLIYVYMKTGEKFSEKPSYRFYHKNPLRPLGRSQVGDRR